MASYCKTLISVFMIVALHVNAYAADPAVDSGSGDLLVASNQTSDESQASESSAGAENLQLLASMPAGSQLACGEAGSIVTGSGIVAACSGTSCSTRNLIGSVP